MSPRRPPAIVVTEDPSGAASRAFRSRTLLAGPPPAEPYDLSDRSLVWAVEVSDAAIARAALDAAARGVALVAAVRLPGDRAARFVDDLDRVADRSAEVPSDSVVGGLDADQRQLLVALSEGWTLTDAAASVGWSRRTCSRRLAEARAFLGVGTTTEAVMLVAADGR